MSFRQRSTSRNYLARPEQRRLLTLVMLLGLVFFLMHQARQPSTWYWFTALSQPTSQVQNAETEIDTRLLPTTERESLPGEFISPAPQPSTDQGDGKYFPGVDPQHFSSIRDDTVFRASEHEAFFNLLSVLKDNDQRTIESASTGPAAFAQLFQQSDQFRGRLVSLHGSVRRGFRLAAPRNDLGIEAYYQLWVQPYDSPGIPMVLYVLELPEGFPTGMQLREDIEFAGFFFKRWAYKAQDGIRTTPLLVGRTVRWERPVAASNEAPGIGGIIAIVGCALAIAGVTVMFALRGGQPALPYRGQRPPRQSVWLAPQEVGMSPEEALRKLADDDAEKS